VIRAVVQRREAGIEAMLRRRMNEFAPHRPLLTGNGNGKGQATIHCGGRGR
jgi:hypothetical protein